MPQHPVATGIGGHQPAQGGAAAGTEIDRQQQARGCGGLLSRLQRHARLGHQHPLRAVDPFDLPHALQGQGQLVALGIGAVHQAGHAACGDHRLAQFVAQGQDLTELLRRRRTDQATGAQRLRRDGVGVALVDLLCVLQPGGAHDGGQPAHEIGAHAACSSWMSSRISRR